MNMHIKSIVRSIPSGLGKGLLLQPLYPVDCPTTFVRIVLVRGPTSPCDGYGDYMTNVICMEYFPIGNWAGRVHTIGS